MVLCHGFGLAPATYDAVADLVAPRVRLLRPSFFRLGGAWDYDRVLRELGAVVDEPAVLVGHSFGGGIALGFAARWPALVSRMVLVDSIGLSARWDLAREALIGTRMQHLVTLPAVRDFFRSWAHSPRSVARAAWWAYSVDKTDEVAALLEAGVRTDVVWAADDTVLGADWGRRFADYVGAGYTVVDATDGPVEHTWVYRRPALFVRTLERLGVLPLP